ncbi:MAG: TIGR01777 family oxidoreductase [Pirellulales bacterium]|nr:TIGR01777 family oxidoreductase [Pirellulales bacterium]
MKTLVTGATGFIGPKLVAALGSCNVLSRSPDRVRAAIPAVTPFRWNAEKELPPAAAFEGVDAVVHLAGEPVAEGRWTAAKKQRIRDSRALGTRNLVAAIEGLREKPNVLVSASAVGYYGDRGDEILDEASPPGSDFLADVCRQWEDAAQRAADFGVRVVLPRIGIVLGDGGGALAKMLPLFNLGLGGRLGSGRQWMPWVHVDDIVGLVRHALDRAELRGPVNAVAPNPVRNDEFTRVLASVLRRPAVLPAPGFGLRLMIGEFAGILLASQRVVPKAAEQSGYQFHYLELRGALEAAVGRGAGHETGQTAARH